MVSLGQLNVQGLGCKAQGKYKDILNEMDLQLLDVLKSVAHTYAWKHIHISEKKTQRHTQIYKT